MPRSRPLPAPAVARSALDGALGGPPLIGGDSRAGYEALLAGVVATVGPADPLEQAWVRDVVDLIWEAVRLRRLKAAMMTACAGDGLRRVLLSMGVSLKNTFELTPRWVARRHDAVEQVDAVLDAAGLGMDHVMAQTLRVIIHEVERIDRMVASAEARRAAILREIAAYRHEFAADLRRAATAAIEAAEFEVVEAGETPAADASAQPAAQLAATSS